MPSFNQPDALPDALALLAEHEHTVIAGATDLYPADAHRQGWGGQPMAARTQEHFLDISRIAALRTITRTSTGIEIGALVTWRQAMDSNLGPWFDGVRLAARDVGGPQVQNRGTLAGNLCNASPAADGVPALMALDARVRLESHAGTREMPLHDFITGNRETQLAANELLTAIVIPVPAKNVYSTFMKLGARRYLVISIAMVAATLEVRDGLIANARVVVGACSSVASRLLELERRLVGVSPRAASATVVPADSAALAPIDDIRATGAYRHHAATVLVQRALDDLADRTNAS